MAYYPKLEITNKAKQLGILTDEDIARIEDGNVGDWFHLDSIKDPTHKRWKENFQKLYKIYPVILPGVRAFIVKHKLYRFFYLIPNFLIIFIQVCVGIYKRDYRYKIYIKQYLYLIKESFLRKDWKSTCSRLMLKKRLTHSLRR